MKVTAPLWNEVGPLLSAALDLDDAARGAWLAGIDHAHPHAAPLLRRMLLAHERAQRSGELESAPRLVGAPWSSAYAAGNPIGPFELVRPLGHGGMGEVWLARQADGRVRREVALKLPAVLHQGEVWRERFRRERDILARLEHPHIARFYDAGVADSGQPWLAMEHVAGTTLMAHVASRPHTLAERLALFRQVLSAVAHAHRHLVVHRDIKPANVLVDAAGQVKLLDFGIAKLLEEGTQSDASGELTRLGGRVMTLRYAAPEQVAEGSITTATDIYALGVMLHEIVTGLSPYRAVRDGKALTEAALLDQHSTMPSRLSLAADFALQCGFATPRKLARTLAGDLDAIVLKAMRRDPGERYESVALFDADVAAYLQRRPVKARAGTWRYLGGRFASRNKLPLALATTVLVTLVAGLVVAETERRGAVAEKARAERHFASVRKLANTLIFDVHAKIENLPGSLAAREMLIATSLEYLDALAAEPGRDPALLLEVASAYRSIASIQGQPRSANRGKLPAAIANLEKSNGLLAELERLRPGDLAAAREHGKTSYSLALAYYQATDPRWQAEMRRTVALAGQVAGAPGASRDDRALLAFVTGRQAQMVTLATGRTAETEATLLGAIAVLEGLGREAGAAGGPREHLMLLYGNAGVMLAGPGRSPPRVQEAIAFLEKSHALARALRAETPGDARRQAFERLATMQLARQLATQGELRRANALMSEVAALVEEMAARDPDDVSLATSRLEILVGAADIANRLGEHPRAIRMSREVLASAAKLPKESLRTREVRIQVPEAKVVLGYALLATAEAGTRDRDRSVAQLLEARALFGEVARYLEEVAAEPSLGAVPEHKLREFAQARARCERALERLAAS